MSEVEENEHPSFTRAKAMDEPFRSLFPKNQDEARGFIPHVEAVALANKVLVVAKTRVECAWAAYCDAVTGMNHYEERQGVLDRGDKVPEHVARAIFPHFDKVPYAK